MSKKSKKAYEQRKKESQAQRGRSQHRDLQVFKNRKKMILDLISSKNYVPMRAKDMAMLLQIPKNQRYELLEVLEELVKEGKADILAGGKYKKAQTETEKKESREEQKSNGRGRKASGFKNEQEDKKPRLQTMNIQDVVDAYQIPEEFPEKVIQMAHRCPAGVLENDYDGRLDLRDWQMVTIDGEDAKDLDDAVSVTEEQDGYLLGVHIADVSNYVQAGSALDKEALKRGTSVYLPDRVIPMLPKELSNGICSLNAQEERLALSCLMKINAAGEVTDYEIAETVIRVDRRMTYTAVNAILNSPEENPKLLEEYADFVPMFRQMEKLSGILRRARQKRGAVEFDFPESKVVLDEEGVPIRIYPYESNTATKLIEDFMLIANETVAREYCERGIPFVYRTHEKPDRDKMEETLQFIRGMDIPVTKRGQDIRPGEVQQILDHLAGSEKEPLVSRLLLRSMARAVYTTECVGHFGLAAEYYCHFTSPIRRYPDLQIHRIIKDDLRGRLDKGGRMSRYAAVLPQVAAQASSTEQRAQETEREAVKLKKAEYMMEHLGEEYDGVISGVTGWGLYVELENTVEGLVHIMSLDDDYYEFDEKEYCLTGEITGRKYCMGQKVRIRVKDAAPANRTVDFVLVNAQTRR